MEYMEMETRKKTYILLIFSVVWAMLIFVLCTMPSSGLPKTNIPHLDKAAHFSVFFVQSVFLSLLFNFQTRKSYTQIILSSTLLAFVYGGLIEVLQATLFDRSGDVLDLIADILGGFLGAMIYPTILRLFSKTFRTYK